MVWSCENATLSTTCHVNSYEKNCEFFLFWYDGDEYHFIVIQDYVIQEKEKGRRRLNPKILVLTMDPE